MFNWFNFSGVSEDYDLQNEDKSLFDRIVDLESRVLNLEIENVELTNALYESETRLWAHIDNIRPVVYNLNSKNWDQ